MGMEAQGLAGEEEDLGGLAGDLKAQALGLLGPRVQEVPSPDMAEVQEDLEDLAWASIISRVGPRALEEIKVGAEEEEEVTWAVREVKEARSPVYQVRTPRLQGKKELRVAQVQVVRIIRIRITTRTSLPWPGALTISGVDLGRPRQAILSSRDLIPCRPRSRRKRRRIRGQGPVSLALLPHPLLLPRRHQLCQEQRSGLLV